MQEDDDNKKLNIVEQVDMQLLQRITYILLERGVQLKRKHDEDNKLLIGNSLFWIEGEDVNNFSIKFNIHPAKWDKDKIKMDIDSIELDIINARGIDLHKVIHNPFRN